MGASKDKQIRVNERNNPVPSPKERAAQEAAAEKKKTNRRYTIGLVVVLVVALLAGLINSSLFDTKLAAVKTGNVSWSLSEVRYAKQTAYSQFSSNYSSLKDYLIDPNTPLTEQDCLFAEGKTWDEYFMDEGLAYLQEMAAYYSLAKSEGYTLTEDEQKTIDDNVALFDTYAKMYGYTTDGYVTALYGEGNSVKTVRKLMEMSLIASDFAQDKQNSISGSYSDEQLDAWYAENADDYDEVYYLSTFVSAETDEEGNASKEAMAAAKATVDSIKALCDGTTEGFSAAVLSVTGMDATEGSSFIGSMGDAAEWANGKRSAGDMTVTESADGYRLYCFVSVDRNEYATVNVRHILIEAEDIDGDGVVSEEEKTAAYNTITSIKNDWDGTEEGFAELANELSQDPGSNTNGGLYENIYKGQMVEEFDDFCFAPHKPGDTDIVYNETYGYFFIYFAGEGESYRHVLARDSLTGEDFTAWKDELLESYPIEKTALFKKV